MHDELVAFYLPFGPPSASFSTEEDLKRREDIWREVRVLMPVVDHLPNSQLVDRIGLRGQNIVLNFVLEPAKQTSLDFYRGGAEPISILLQRDLELLRQSAAAQQKAIFLDASASISSGFAGSKRRRGNQHLHKVMKKYAGHTLVLPFDNGPLALTFPAYPDYRYDGMTRTISAFVTQTQQFMVHLRGIRYVGDVDPASLTLGKARKRPAVLPFVEDRCEVGMLCAAAQFADVRLHATVRTALRYHDGIISHYEIVEIQNKMELLSKLGELFPANYQTNPGIAANGPSVSNNTRHISAQKSRASGGLSAAATERNGSTSILATASQESARRGTARQSKPFASKPKS